MCDRKVNISGTVDPAPVTAQETDPLVAVFVERSAKNRRNAVCKQLLLAFPVFLLAIAAGMPIGYSPVVMPQLYNSNDSLRMDIEMYSWFVSTHSVIAPIGSLLSGNLMDAAGRRFGCMVPVPLLMLGWTLIASANSHFMLLAGRMFAGLGVGLVAAPAQILLAECSEPSIRGVLVGVPVVAYSFGILLVYTLGALMSWRAVAWCGPLIPVVAVFMLLVVPESPTWLVRKGRLEQAKRALLWLRCDEPTAHRELNTIAARYARECSDAGQSMANNGGESVWRLATQSAILKPLTIISGFNVLGMLAGTYLVVFYVIDIISDIDIEVNSMHAAIYTATVRLISALLCSVLVHKMNRRTMLLTASVVAAASCLGLVAWHWLRAGVFARTPLDTYVSAGCLLVYISASMTFMMFPGIMVSELLPARVRGKVSGLIFGTIHVVFFGTAKIFPYFAQAAKTDGVFVLFGICSLLVGVFIYALMPETRGRTLGQIEDYFVDGKWLWMRRPTEMRVAGQNDERCA